MIISEQQKRDRDMCSAIWYMIRDYGDIQNNDSDDRWRGLIGMADDTSKEYPESKGIINKVITLLEDRSIGEEAARAKREEADRQNQENMKIIKMYRSLRPDDRAKIVELMGLYQKNSGGR